MCIRDRSKGAKIEVNGKAIDGVTAGEYATVAGSWKVGDKIVVTIPLQLRTESTDDRKDIQTLFYGCLLYTSNGQNGYGNGNGNSDGGTGDGGGFSDPFGLW